MNNKDFSSLQIYSETGKLLKTNLTFRNSLCSHFSKGRPLTEQAIQNRNLSLSVEQPFLAPTSIQCYPTKAPEVNLVRRSRSPKLLPIRAKEHIFELIDVWREETSLGNTHGVNTLPFGQKTITIMPKSMSPEPVEIDLYNSPMYRKQQCSVPALRPTSPVVHRGREKQLKEAYEAALDHLGHDEMSISSKISKEEGVDQRLSISKFGLSEAGRKKMWRKYRNDYDNDELGLVSNMAKQGVTGVLGRVPSQTSEVLSESHGKLSKKATALVRKYTVDVTKQVNVVNSARKSATTPVEGQQHTGIENREQSASLTDPLFLSQSSLIDEDVENEPMDADAGYFDVYPSLGSASGTDVLLPVSTDICVGEDFTLNPSPMSDTSRQQTALQNTRLLAPFDKAVISNGRIGSGLEDDSFTEEHSMQDSIDSTGTGSVYALNRPQFSEKGVFVPPTLSPEQLRSPLSDFMTNKIGPAIRAASTDRRLKREKEKQKISLMFRSAGISMPKSVGAFPLVGPKDTYEKTM